MLKATGILILRRQDGALLLQHRDKNKYIKYPNMWGSPGGHVKSNETYLECACRELFEETGYKVSNLKFLKTFKEKSIFGLTIVKLYWDYYDGKQKIKCYEGQKIKFIKLQNIKKYKIVNIVLVTWKKIIKFI